MSSNLNNKNKLYEFEKFAIIIVIVLAVVITLLVIFATSGDDDGDSADNKKQTVIEETDNNKDNIHIHGSSDGDASVGDSQPPVTVDTLEFESITVSNNLAVNNDVTLATNDLLFVNQDYEYKENIDEFLVNVYEEKSNAGCGFSLPDIDLCLRKEASDALISMVQGFVADTNTPSSNLNLYQAYVDVATQQSRYDRDAANADRSELPYMQAGGQSELQTGLSLRLIVYKGGGKMGEGTYQWFYDNCYKYGFILRYPEGEEDRTQFKADESRFRYVGVPHATYIHLNKWVLEDYLDYLVDKTDCNNRTEIKDHNRVSYEVYAVRVEDGESTQIPVPAASTGWSYSICNANNGYFIVTMSKQINE